MMTFIMSNPSHPFTSGTGAAKNGQQRALDAASEPALARVIERARWLAALEPLLCQCLPAPLTDHVRLANVNDNHVVFLVRNAVWKTKLRQYSHLVEAAAVAAGLPARSLMAKISPDLGQSLAEPPTGKPLSTVTRNALLATAQSLADPELSAQLRRLASLP